MHGVHGGQDPLWLQMSNGYVYFKAAGFLTWGKTKVFEVWRLCSTVFFVEGFFGIRPMSGCPAVVAGLVFRGCQMFCQNCMA